MMKDSYLLLPCLLPFLTGTGANIISSDSNCIEDCINKHGKKPVCDEGGYQFDNLCVAQECSKVIRNSYIVFCYCIFSQTRYKIACQSTCPCPKDGLACNCAKKATNYVCGVNGVTYRNKVLYLNLIDKDNILIFCHIKV